MIRYRPLLITLFFATTGALASGSPAVSGAPARPRTPHEQAILRYNDGVHLRERAARLEQEWATEKNEQKRAKIRKNVEQQYARIIDAQQEVIQKDPTIFQAYAELGYAYRKSGDYARALEAYDRALAAQPLYAEAIEYRAEAYLGLNRLEDAKSAYLVLFDGGAKEGAGLLATAMQRWVAKHRTNPEGIAPESVEQLATWIAQRHEISTQSNVSMEDSWQ